MALKAVHVSDVPNLDQVQENATFSLCSTHFSKEVEFNRVAYSIPKFLVIGHRGHGKNKFQTTDRRMEAIKENSIMSFNAAAKYPLDFIEFDVQVTKDGCPVIFHDDVILSVDNLVKQGTVAEKRVTDLTLSEFLSHGTQRNTSVIGKALFRKTKDGKIVKWEVEEDDSLCTLQDAFQLVKPSLGFNIELKFDDHTVYHQDHLIESLHSVLNVVFECANDRPIIFSSFQPDAALLVGKLQNKYPVFFLTDAGTRLYDDVRRNSLEEAVKVCLQGGLQGIVSHAKGVFANPSSVIKIKDAKLSLVTYGELNNVAEAVHMQHLMGIDGVIVDFVQEITEVVSDMIFRRTKVEDEEELDPLPKFSQKELSFLLRLIPELIRL
ncbi:hypothetical protein K2173_027159 [Erythroxylum novogranatense]|uniref:glycerophosphodiester phosphodiesterase n=1 Tax=Erythroxylum novogranatense TaxID=1862640 RepID=A0AAV8TY73_9ROSI|nr:hypothetical protein K2173_027159 [Erythroxylum novogranatense]